MFYRAYLYRLLNGGERRSAQVEFMNYRRSDDNSLLLGYRYTYDEQGNISAVYKSNATGTDTNPTWTYTYDGLGQLSAATDADAGYSYAYTYGTAGNIRSATASGQNSVSKTFSYANAAWPDLLTSVTVGGTTKSIAYETVNGNLTGNPITYYNGSDYTFTWSKGTQLTSATMGDTEISYAYDMSGVRSSKTVGGTTYTYTTLSGLVMQETDGTQELYFLYDDSSQPYALVYKSSATAEPLFYYYLLNVQGDVVALMNTSGTIVARYSYDPWGVPTVKTVSGTQGNDAVIGNVNPLRYRGYYYDTETGFYYLQSRYYDPVIGRFISSDNYASTGQGFIGCNMFAYCGNNPICRVDPSGYLHTTQMVSGWSAAKELAEYVFDLAADILAITASAFGIAGGVATAGVGGVVLALTSLETLHIAFLSYVYDTLKLGIALSYTMQSGGFQYTTYSVFEQDGFLGKTPLNPNIKTIDGPAQTVIKKAEGNKITPQTRGSNQLMGFTMSGKSQRNEIFPYCLVELPNGWRPGYDLRGNPAGFGFWCN